MQQHLNRLTRAVPKLARYPLRNSPQVSSYLAHIIRPSSTSSSSTAEAPAAAPIPPQTTILPSPQPPLQPRLIYPESPSKDHHDLESYVAYADRTALRKKSTVFVGTRFEYVVLASLRRLGFDLRRIGGRSDGGIDLLGTWTVPSRTAHLSPPSISCSVSQSSSSSSPPTTDNGNDETSQSSSHTNLKSKGQIISDPQPPTPLRVIVQCKATTTENSRIGPHYIRELEGAFRSAPAGWRTTARQSSGGVVGVLVAQRSATKGTREALGRSQWPMAYVLCTAEGSVQQLLWNKKAEEEGLDGMGVAVQHSEGPDGQKVEELVLTWRGRPYNSTAEGEES